MSQANQNASTLLSPSGRSAAPGRKREQSFMRSKTTTGKNTFLNSRVGASKAGRSRFGSKKNQKGKGNEKTKVYMNGLDVTPKPLGQVKMKQKSAVASAASLLSSYRGNMSAVASNFGSGRGNKVGPNHSAIGAPSATSSYAGGPTSGHSVGVADAPKGSLQPKSFNATRGVSAGPAEGGFHAIPEEGGPSLERKWTNAELNERISIDIIETPTITLFHIPSLRVWGDDEKERTAVIAANNRYTQVLEDHKGADAFTSSPAQTLNEAQRTKEVQVTPPATVETGCGVSTWEIHDAYHESASAQDEENVDDDVENITGIAGLESQVSRSSDGTTDADSSSMSGSQASLATGISSSYVESDLPESQANYGNDAVGVPQHHFSHMDSELVRAAVQYASIASKPTFLESLKVMECALLQNEMHDQQLLYRESGVWYEQADLLSFSEKVDADEASAAASAAAAEDDVTPDESAVLEEKLDEGASTNLLQARSSYGRTVTSGSVVAEELAQKYLDRQSSESGVAKSADLIPLWSYKCSDTDGFNVMCMDWNRRNEDLLAAGYGEVEKGVEGKGLILFWSVKNPKYPLKKITTKYSVMSLDFCTESPHLLAVGLYDGSVLIFDVRDDGEKPMMEALHATGKHSEPVWGIRWVNKGQGGAGQSLVSISTDGYVLQWSMKKGLTPKELMQLKRVPNLAQLKPDAIDGISRQASALCFDFPSTDNTQYFTGTEDGIIHKCSVSYNEQTLESYYGHTGPVYHVRCSPFVPDAFLSCSSDWTCSLWAQALTRPVLSFQSGQDHVNDVQWCPNNSCVFATVCRDGRVEVWDMEKSALDPVIPYKTHQKDRKINCLAFSRNSPVLLTGASNGEICVYRVYGVDLMKGGSNEEQGQRLLQAMVEHSNSDGFDSGVDKKAILAQMKVSRDTDTTATPLSPRNDSSS